MITELKTPVFTAAQIACEDGRMLGHAVDIEALGRPDFADYTADVNALETEWSAYSRANELAPDLPKARARLMQDILGLCPKNKWIKCRQAPRHALESATPSELAAIHTAALFARFLSARGATLKPFVPLSALFTENRFGCASSGLLGLSLFAQSSVSLFEILHLPNHVVLGLKLASGREFFFNNAQEFVPEAYFELPKLYTQFVPRYAEILAPAVTIFSPVHITRGIEETTDGHFEAAIKSYEAALEINPEDPTAHLAMGLALLKLERFADAELSANQALCANPNFASALVLLGDTYRSQDREREARLEYKRALDLDPGHRQARQRIEIRVE